MKRRHIVDKSTSEKQDITNKSLDTKKETASHSYKDKAFNFIKRIYLAIEWAPIALTRELISTFARISGWRYVSIHLTLQIAALFIGNAISYALNRVFAKEFQNLEENFQKFSAYGKEDLAAGVDDHWVGFQKKIWEVVQYVGYYIVSTTISNLINRYFEIRLTRKLEDDLNKKKFSNQTGYGLSHNMESDIISRNLAADANNITSDGIAIMTSSFTAAQNAILSFTELLAYSRWINVIGAVKVPDLIATSALYGYTTQFISGIISNKHTQYNNELIKLRTKFEVIKVHDSNNIKTITERGGEEYTRKRYLALQQEVRHIEKKSMLITTVQTIWKLSHGFANKIFKFVVIGRRLYDQTLAHDDRGLVFDAVKNVEPFFTWKETNYNTITGSKATLARVNKFLDGEKTLLEKPRKLDFKTHNAKSLVIEDFWLRIGDNRLLVNIPRYLFAMGKRYLLTGDSGNGKSTLLAKIYGIINTGEINASGTIYEPQTGNNGPSLKKSMLTQADYFPKYSTLLEAICYPDQPPQDIMQKEQLKAKIIKLLKEAKIDDVGNDQTNDNTAKQNESIIDLLEKIEDWDTRLSGGQKKKVQIIAQIIKNPDILILDEAFTGLDTKSIGLLHNLLIKHIPQTMMLIVDHHGVTNNKLSGQEFCQEHLHFVDHKVTEVGKGIYG